MPIGAAIVNRLLPETAEGAFLATRRERGYLEEIEKITAALTTLHVPLLESDVAGPDQLHEVAGLLFGDD